MGGMAAVVVLVIVAVLVAVVFAAVRFTQREQQHETEVLDSGDPTLVYRLPEGQDPAAVLAALRREGFDAAPVPGGTGHEVLISCPDGVDRHRAEVRGVIQHAATLEGGDEQHVPPVRFTDE